MQKMNKGNSIGISLILVVFILLCLITFGTLSLMLANADNALSISTAENISQYYAADSIAQEELASIDASLQKLYTTRKDYVKALEEEFEGVTVDGDTVYLTFITPVSDREQLVSTLELYTTIETVYYRIVEWTLESVPIQ